MATVPAHLEAAASLEDAAHPLDDITLEVPPEAHTLAGFRAWVFSNDFPEKRRLSYIQGQVILDLSMEEIQTHAAVKTEIGGVLWNLKREVDYGDLYINGVLVTNEEADVSNSPDMVAVFWESLDADLVRYVRRKNKDLEINGSPDWLMEIVSDGSVRKDTKLLRQAYHQAKVREYWLIDARGSDLSFQILHWRKSGFVAAEEQDGWKKSKVFGRHFRLTRNKDRRGAWKYRLEVRNEK